MNETVCWERQEYSPIKSSSMSKVYLCWMSADMEGAFRYNFSDGL